MTIYMVCVAFGDKYVQVNASNEDEARNKAVKKAVKKAEQDLTIDDLEIYATDADEESEEDAYV